MRTIVIILLCFSAVSVRAQSVRTFTVEEAIGRARERAPERKRTDAVSLEAEALRKNASTFFTDRPELEIEYITEKPFGDPAYDFSIGLTQEIPLWGISARKRNLASAVERSAEASRASLDNLITLRTRLLYNRAWSLSQQLNLVNSLQTTSAKLSEAIDKRLNAGDVSTLDRNTVVLEANSIRIEHERVHSAYDQAIGELEALTGMPLQNAVLLPDTLSSITFSFDSIQSYRLSPEWVRLEHEIEVAKAEADVARAEIAENPALGLHYVQELLVIDADQFNYFNGAPRTISDIRALHRNAGISLSMQLPLTIPGLWGPSNLEVIEREAEVRSLEADKATLELELAGRIARLRPKFSRIHQALRIYQESVDLIAENYELLTRGYEGGELSVTELLVGRQQLIELQTQQLELIQEMREAEIELQSILAR